MHGLNVLVVDDDIGDRKLLRRILGGKEFEANVTEAESAPAALSSESKAFDAIFLDYHLPMTTGLSALATFRETWPRAAVFLMTGQGDEEVAKSAILEGASDYLTKSNINATLLLRLLKDGVESARLRTRLEEQHDDLSTFAEVLVHDFRAPIRAAAYLAQQVEEDLEAGDTVVARHGLTVLQSSAAQMMDMIKSLSDHIRFDRDEAFEAAHPHILVSRALKAIELDITQSKAAVDTTMSIDTPSVLVQPPQIIQVIQNLVANSLKFSGPKSPEITVTVSEDKCGMVMIEVKDKGIGIPQEFRDRIFEPFKRVPGSAEINGTGLGLATCKKVVQRHGGRIWCESEIAAGTTIRFTLPIADKIEIAAQDEGQTRYSPKGQQASSIVV